MKKPNIEWLQGSFTRWDMYGLGNIVTRYYYGIEDGANPPVTVHIRNEGDKYSYTILKEGEISGYGSFFNANFLSWADVIKPTGQVLRGEKE